MPLQKAQPLSVTGPLVFQRPTAAQIHTDVDVADGVPHLYATSIWDEAAAYSLCVEAQALVRKGPTQGSHTVHRGLLVGVLLLHSEKMLLLVSVLISLGLRPLLLSVTTIVGLDQFTVFQIPKDTSHVGQETDISPPPPVVPPPRLPFSSNSFHPQNVGLLHEKMVDCRVPTPHRTACSVQGIPASHGS